MIMKATDFINGSVVRTIKGSNSIELSRTKTPSVSGWYVAIYNNKTMALTVNQYHQKFKDAKKHYEGLCKNFPVI